MNQPLTIALSKGRIFRDVLPLLHKMGIQAVDDPDTSRKLILDTNLPHIKLIIIRAADVPTYVEYGAADCGVAGKDVLLEHNSENLYELLDLRIAQCKLMVAVPKNKEKQTQPLPFGNRLRVATKYVKSTQKFYAQKGIQIEIIKLYGSMELAPLVGLADHIVDVVDTGNTLKANGLEAVEHICDISSRLIVNRAAMKMKQPTVKDFVHQLSQAVRGE